MQDLNARSRWIFEKDIGDMEKAETSYNQFKWNLEKHFFVEEKAIFSMFRDIFGDSVSDIFDLLSQHSEIMILLGDVEKDMSQENLNKLRDTVSKLKNKLTEHADFEDMVFYPKLDNDLPDIQKREILARAKEIIRE